MRCVHEASLHEDNCFITLTFNEENVNRLYSLQKDYFVKFMKRLRKLLSEGFEFNDRAGNRVLFPAGTRVRFFHAGEYGEEFGRPHHHAIIFGFDFPDKKLKRERDGMRYYESEILNKLWSDPRTGESYGFHEISDVTFESAAYVARYVVKKINGEDADEHYSFVDEQGNFYKRLPEYCTMSRGSGVNDPDPRFRGGIGSEWYEKYKDTDVWPHDRIVIRGKVECKPPRYYGNKYELTDPYQYDKIRASRKEKAKASPDNSWSRLAVREQVKLAELKFLKRTLK